MRSLYRALQVIAKRTLLKLLLIFILVSILAILHLRITITNLGEASYNFVVLGREAWPPDFSVISKRASWAHPPCGSSIDWVCSPAVVGMVQTIEIAFLAPPEAGVRGYPHGLFGLDDLESLLSSCCRVHFPPIPSTVALSSPNKSIVGQLFVTV